jgi:hypothetical protein
LQLFDLGQLGGLLPKCQPKSDYLHKVISLSAGLVSFEEDATAVSSNGNSIQSVPEETAKGQVLPTAENGPQTITPIEKLKNALSSKEKFETHYLVSEYITASFDKIQNSALS